MLYALSKSSYNCISNCKTMRIFQIMTMMAMVVSLAGQSINDPAAEKVIKDLRSKYESYKSIEVEFEMNFKFGNGQTDQQKGTLIQEGDKFKMDATTQAIYCDGTSVWMHIKESKEVQINDYDEDEEVANFSPNSILAMYDNGEYEFAITNEAMIEGILTQSIEFKPLDKDSEYSKVRLTIDKKKQELRGFELFSKDGTKVSLKITSIKVDKSYPNNIFVFNKYENPNVHIEDLRID